MMYSKYRKEKKKSLSTRATRAGKTVLHRWRRDKDIHRQKKRKKKKAFIIARPALQEMLKEILQIEMKGH